MTASAYPLRKAKSSNSAAVSFTAKEPTTTEPTGDGVIDVFSRALGLAHETKMPKFLNVIPFGDGANDTTFDMRVWAWSKTVQLDDVVWIPQLLVQLNVTLGDIDAAVIAASNLLADTIAIAAGDADAALISPANDTTASILVHLRGAEKVEFDFDMTGATSGNALWRVMDQD